jgi:hypothetical protein
VAVVEVVARLEQMEAILFLMLQHLALTRVVLLQQAAAVALVIPVAETQL